MIFNKTKFGKIWIDQNKYKHDIYLYPDGTIEKRDKSHSPRIGGHRSLSEWEINKILEQNPEIVIIGMGQSGVLPFTEKVEEILDKLDNRDDIEVIKGNTPDILDKTNNALTSGKKVAGIFHTTC
ncbi:MAG: hypothetical protein EU547_05700 [Promethearchaeota archaeon]|nr:MAG: hypothetical protein EU547_05700 [Candidatus Lokiarchaeota archaeon]